MSWTIKPKSFYAEQLKKLEDRAKEGKETSPKLVEKYYQGYLGRNGTVVSPAMGITDEIRPYRRVQKLVWANSKPPRPTKPCQRCGKPIEKPLREGAKTWEQRKFHSLCKKLHHETMLNVSESSN